MVKKEWGGAVIGKGGETIKGLRRQLRANIVIHPPKERRLIFDIYLNTTAVNI